MGAGGSGDARNFGPNAGGRWTGEDIRQFRREFREWQGDAEDLRRQLEASGVNPRDLEGVMRDLRTLDSDQIYADPQGLEKLRAAALDRLKKVEFDLRKRVDTDHDALSLSGSDEVPAGFRQAIEEYYRSLGREKQSR